jgi:hypothetical protein
MTERSQVPGAPPAGIKCTEPAGAGVHHVRTRLSRDAAASRSRTRLASTARQLQPPPVPDQLRRGVDAVHRTDSPVEGAGFEPSVPRGCARRVVCRFSCAPTFSVGGELSRGDIQRLVVSRGTDGSNPSPSSRESGEIVGSATLAGRGRCFTAPRLFIWGLSISRAPLQAWAGNVLATSLSESGLGDDMAR